MPWFLRNLSIFIAWTIVFGVSKVVGYLIGMPILGLGVLVWMAVGGMVLMHLKVQYPVPSGEKFDLKGALSMIWWMAWWPWFLKKK